MPKPKAFLLPDLSGALIAAQSLLGWELVHDGPDGLTSGYIVETEAYHQDDPASHSFNGKRLRNAAMFESAGTIYVYFTYGMHYCVNIVTGPAGEGQGVLIRALQPVDGVELMRQRRGVSSLEQLTNGPAKLVQAMGIRRDHGGSRLGQAITLEPGFATNQITQTTRVGIKKAVDQPWRFYVSDNLFVSRR